MVFKWTTQCQDTFDLLQQSQGTMFQYPEPNKEYTLFTHASKYDWACVLTQSFGHEIEGKKVVIQHPIKYQSGVFKESQLNSPVLTKEAHTIYMSVNKLSTWKMWMSH